MRLSTRLRKDGFVGIQFQMDIGEQRKLNAVCAAKGITVTEFARDLLLGALADYPDVAQAIAEIDEQRGIA